MTALEIEPTAVGVAESHSEHVHHDLHPLDRVARWVSDHRRLVLVGWLLLVLTMAPLAITLNGALSGAGWDASGSESAQVRSELSAQFPQLGAEAAMVVVSQEAPFADDPANLTALLASLQSAPEASVMVDPLTQPAEAGLIAPDGRTALIPMQLAGSEDADLPESAGALISYVDGLDLPEGVRVEVTGQWAMWSDFNETNEKALHKAELLSGLPSMILLFLAFGSVVAAGLPLILAVAGIAFGFGALHLIGMALPLSVWSMNFSMMIGLAVGIDYSLFIVSRYREERYQGKPPREAMGATLSTAGFAVLLSALAVVLSLAAVFIVPVMVFRAMALGMILSVSAVAVAALTLLPVVLLLMGDRVLESRRQHKAEEKDERLWGKWTRMALRRPGMTLAAGLVLLFVLVLPAMGMRLGMPDARVVDEGHSSRDGYEMLVAAFGEGAAAPIFVTVDAGEAEQAVATAFGHETALDARVVAGPSAEDRVVVRVTSTEGVDSSRTMDLVEDLRRDLDSAAPSALVGGPASQSHDLTEVLTTRAPYAVAIIMVGAFLMLLLVFRSVVVAFVSVLLNLLSVAAAFGFATLVFQQGHGASLIGIEHQGFVNAWAPLFFFALLFGLSMDYQLFLLAAIRERYEEHGDTRLAVREGIARTGRPITNAALIMIVVFIAFGVTGPIPPTELGITLAFAVFLDATVIRMLLVPAIMGLLNGKNWWLPRWLDERMPVIRFSH
jgi:putative drug exporter of the RND superfamily